MLAPLSHKSRHMQSLLKPVKRLNAVEAHSYGVIDHQVLQHSVQLGLTL